MLRMNTFGHRFRLAIWGESHGPQIGVSIDGLPAGIPLCAADFEADPPAGAEARPAPPRAAKRTCRRSSRASGKGTPPERH